MEEQSCINCMFHDICALRTDVYNTFVKHDWPFLTPQTGEEHSILYFKLYSIIGLECKKYKEKK